MEKINKDNINTYYELINKKVDGYVSMGVSPSALKRYFKKGSKGLNNFLRKEEIDNVERIDQVLHDVIDDRIAQEEASIMTFENFKHNVLNIKYLISDDTILKLLSNRFKVSMGRIEQDHNFFTISDLGRTIELVAIDESKLSDITRDLAIRIYRDFIGTTYTYDNIIKLDYKIKDKVDGSRFIDTIANNELSDNIIHIIEELVSITTEDRFEYKEKLGEFLIFRKMN